METTRFNFDEYHRRFIRDTEQYHQRQASYVGKQDWFIEIENRLTIIGQLNDLLTNISDKSYCLIDILLRSIKKNNPRNSIIMDKELELFTDIISSLFNLMSHKEDVYKWSYELRIQKKHVENIDKEQTNEREQ